MRVPSYQDSYSFFPDFPEAYLYKRQLNVKVRYKVGYKKLWLFKINEHGKHTYKIV